MAVQNNTNLMGFTYQLGAVVFSLITDIFIKITVVDYPLIEIMFYRSVAGIPMLFVYLICTGNLQQLRIYRPGLHLLRSSCGIVGMFLIMTSYKHLPFAEASAILYIAPILITVLSVIILHETIYAHRIYALIFAFAGAMIIVRPDMELNWYYIYPFLGAFAFSAVTLSAHVLTRTDHPIGVTLIFFIFTSLITGGITAYHGFSPLFNSNLIWYAIVMGNAGLIAQILNMHAVHKCQPSFYAITKYMSLFGAAAAGLILFDELISLPLTIGMIMIVSAGIYISWKEHNTV